MLNRQELTNIIREFVPETEFPEGTQLLEAIVPADKLFGLAQQLKSNDKAALDYLVNHTAVDFLTHFTVVYHLDSTKFRHMVVLKSVLNDHENPMIDSLTEVYAAAEFFEREVFDLFGIRYNNHPNLKRFFLEDDYGHPLRKDFQDEIIFIER
jgi:NADH:ubiquinone oxidoreductase subunit C